MVRFTWRFVLYFACLPCQAWRWTSEFAEQLNPKWRDDTKSSCYFLFRLFLIVYGSPHQRPCDRLFFNGAVTWSVLQRCAGHLHHPRRGRSSSCTKVIVTSLWQCWIHPGMILNDSKSFSGPLPIYDFNSALHVNLPCHCEDRLEDHEKGEDWHLIALLNGYMSDLTDTTPHRFAAHLCEASFGAPSKSLYLGWVSWVELCQSYHCASLPSTCCF